MIIFSINLYKFSVTGHSPHRDVVTFTDVDSLAGSKFIAGLQVLAAVARSLNINDKVSSLIKKTKSQCLTLLSTVLHRGFLELNSTVLEVVEVVGLGLVGTMVVVSPVVVVEVEVVL